MSALGQKQTSKDAKATSALPPKAHITERDRHVRFVLKADINLATIQPLRAYIVDQHLVLIDDLNKLGDGLLLALQVAAQLCQLKPQRIVFIEEVLARRGLPFRCGIVAI